MAQSISINSGSVLIGSPIEVSVQAESAGGKATFHRVKLIVSAALSTEGEYEDFELSSPVTDGETVHFDISDVLRTVAGKYTFAPVTQTTDYPYLAYQLKAYDEYMVDGILTDKVGERNYGSTMYALMGAFTDAERYLSDGTKGVTTFSRKPLTGEVCSQNESVVYPMKVSSSIDITNEISSGARVYIKSLSGESGQVEVGERKVYVGPNAENRFQFQFVNGLGIVESISAESLESIESSGTTETIAVTAPASFKGVNRLAVQKSGRRSKYKLSTGYTSKEWALWWLTEFFGSDNFRNTLTHSCWMKIDSHWIPCVPVLDDDISLYDRTKKDMIRIDFTVHLALDGFI